MSKSGERKNVFILFISVLLFVTAGTSVFAEGANLIANGDFSTQLENWQFWAGEGGSGFVYVNANQEAIVEVWNGGSQDWSVQLYQQSVVLQQGVTYTCKFNAKAESARSITVVAGMSADPWTAYSQVESFELSTEMQEYRFTFTMDAASDVNAQLGFDMGLNTADIVIDDVEITEVGASQIVKYEVENGVLAGGAVYWATEICSNGAKVAGLGFGGSSTLTIEAPSSGTFETEVAYLGDNDHPLEIFVNGQYQSTIVFPNTGGWFIKSTQIIPLTLQAGTNTVSFGHREHIAAPDLDYIAIDFAKIMHILPRYAYEAEDGLIEGTALVQQHSQCSGASEVTGINDTGSVTITAEVAEEGFYSAFFKYNSSKEMYFLVEINGRDLHYVWMNNVYLHNRPETTFTPIYLNQGINTIKIFNNQHETMDLDCLNLVGSSPLVYETFDFENGTAGWTQAGTGNAYYALEATQGMNNSACISVENPTGFPGKNYWKRSVYLEPGNYFVRAMVKGENITPATGGTGANINVEHTWDRNGDNGLLGTFDWREVYLPLNVKEVGYVDLCFTLGFYFSHCTGKVYFDDVVIMDDFSKVRVEGVNTYVNVDVEDAELVSRASLERWVEHLDALSLYMRDLCGGAVFEGRKVGVDYSYRYPGGWAVAGEPIIWFKPYVSGELPRIETMDDWIDGICHEFGHCTHYGDKVGTWNWNDEIWANFKKSLALIDLNGQVYGFGRMFVGPEVKILYRDYHGGGGYTNSFAKGTYSGDGLVYVLLDLRDKIGTEAFKLTFRDLYTKGLTGANTRLEKFQGIVDLLNHYSGNQPGYIENLLGPDWDVIVTSELYYPGEPR